MAHRKLFGMTLRPATVAKKMVGEDGVGLRRYLRIALVSQRVLLGIARRDRYCSSSSIRLLYVMIILDLRLVGNCADLM